MRVWAFVLDALRGAIRLISRNRLAMVEPSLANLIEMAVMKPGSLAMEQKMLHGIRERAGRLSDQSELAPSA